MHNECIGYGNCMAHAFPLISEIHRPTNVDKTGHSGGMTKLMHLANDKIRNVVQLFKLSKCSKFQTLTLVGYKWHTVRSIGMSNELQNYNGRIQKTSVATETAWKRPRHKL